MNIKKKFIIIFIFPLLLYCFKFSVYFFSVKTIKIFYSSKKNSIYNVSEEDISFNKNIDEKIYLKFSNNKVSEFINNEQLIRSIFDKSLDNDINKNNHAKCICIYNTPKLIFKEGNSIKIETYDSLQLNLDLGVFPESNFKYKSDHPDIIEVKKNGKITAIRPGIAIITVSGFGYKKGKIQVTSIVKKGLINNHTLDINNASQYSNVMIVAHPDDETLWGGANLYKDDYFVVCLTNGYNEVRANDFQKIMKFTNNTGILLNYPDVTGKYIDDWSNVKDGLLHDLKIILEYKNWNKIVTYGPDGTYGHIHHKKTSEYITKLAIKTKKYSHLYYFAKYYKKNEIPENLSRISDNELNYKYQEILLYKSTKKDIDKYFIHVVPYEKLILASESKNIFK